MTIKGEKIFSLFQSAANLPARDDIQAQWKEFFAYLFVSLFYAEGADPTKPNVLGELNNSHFNFGNNVYHSAIGRVLSKGLFERYYILSNNSNLSDKEKRVLDAFNFVFVPRTFRGRMLKAHDLTVICTMRSLDQGAVALAEHLGVMIGQTDFDPGDSVPRLALSLFGNIHLCPQDRLSLRPPTLLYGDTAPSGDTVTALWSLLSSMTQTLANFDYPGDALGDIVTHYNFISHDSSSRFIPLPKIASSLFTQNLLGLGDYNPVYISALFYKQFLYGSIEAKDVTRDKLMYVIMRQLSDAVGEARADYLFKPESYYRRLATGSVQGAHKTPIIAPAFIKMALEALEPDLGDDVDTADADVDPAVDPAVDVVPPANGDDSENSMDLVSFNKAGEGINEDLYRSAVVALNSRIQSDSNFPVTPEIKQALNQWVNGWIYRAAISATKDQIATLKLTQHLKTVSHIPTK